MKNLGGVILAATLATLVSGCSSDAGDKVEAPPCAATFDVSNSPETLGSGARFNAELQNVKTRTEPFPLVEVTNAAGWSDDWDRVVEVRVNTTGAKLNGKAETAGYCWKNIPESDGEGFRPQEYWLFVKDGRPVQSVRWQGPTPVLQVGSGALTKESMLAADGKGWIVPQP
ncbi:hypothetical protein [Nocardia sp. NPDC056000]|uniref:hypothetical protein n=1 Tax=Nocardia sp. NPDC056000 TaxID=3345674 RepID=UPI0035E0FB1E